MSELEPCPRQPEPEPEPEPSTAELLERARASTSELLALARPIAAREKGYADRKGRKGNVDRLLFKNFGQRPPQRDTRAYREGHERIFGSQRPPLNPGQRDGYVVRPYKGSVLPEELDFGAYTHEDPNADPGEVE